VKVSATQVVDGITKRVPLSVTRRVIRRGVLGINYHVVSDHELPHISHVLQYKSVKTFEGDLAYLQRHHDVISYGDALEVAPAAGDGFDRQRRNGNSVLLTFDDGYRECFSVVRPVLARHGIPCLFFVIADAVDNRFLVYPNKVSLCIDNVVTATDAVAADHLRLMGEHFGLDFPTVGSFARWMRSLQIADTTAIDAAGSLLGIDWQHFLGERRPFMTGDEIRQLVAEGFTVGAHSLRHPYLRTLGDRASVEEEIVESCRFVKELTGQDRVPFAFPFSADGLDRDFLSDVVQRHDFIGLLFNTRELERDRSFIVNRVAGDGGLVPYGQSHLSEVLGAAYRRYMVRQFQTFVASTGLRSRRVSVGQGAPRG